MWSSITRFQEDDLPLDINLRLPSPDFLYHLWFDSNWENDGKNVLWWKSIEEMFWDVTHVCMWGSHERAQRFAETLNKEQNPEAKESVLEPIWKTERFSLYKVWSVISVSHGMGMPSMSILLEEIAKLLYYAKWQNIDKVRDEVNFIRIGTSGWVWVEWWTVVIAENAMNAFWEHEHEEVVLWHKEVYPTFLHQGLSLWIQAANIQEEVWKNIHVVLWDTVGTNDFYRWQWRVDWLLQPWYDATDKLEYLEFLHEKGARNIEMESTCFAAFCLRLGIPGAIVCVALLNRLEQDQVTVDLEDISENAEKIVLNYLRKVQAI